MSFTEGNPTSGKGVPGFAETKLKVRLNMINGMHEFIVIKGGFINL